MVRAILEGRKTQTRRVIKGRIALKWLEPGMFLPSYVADPGNDLCPYGVPGDTLWVRETLTTSPLWDGELRAIYAADGAWAWDLYNPCLWPWKRPTLPSIHMPRGLCRINLAVTSVRVQRVQDISEEDAIAEGVADLGIYAAYSVRDKFQAVWNDINAKRGYSWESNPWVWAVTFERAVK
jgi:hypothetical protein